jgi:hypothetical protein
MTCASLVAAVVLAAAEELAAGAALGLALGATSALPPPHASKDTTNAASRFMAADWSSGRRAMQARIARACGASFS